MSMIPDDAKRVFKGVVFDVYQWPQEQFDGSIETYERLKRPDIVVTVAVTPEGKLLVMDDEQPARAMERSFCSGRMEPGEKPLEAAKRELLEETGYSSDEWEHWFDVPGVSKIEMTIHYFVARNIKKTSEQRLDPGERISVLFQSVDEALDDIIADKLKSFDLGTHILRQIVHGNREELKSFLTNRKR